MRRRGCQAPRSAVRLDKGTGAPDRPSQQASEPGGTRLPERGAGFFLSAGAYTDDLLPRSATPHFHSQHTGPGFHREMTRPGNLFEPRPRIFTPASRRQVCTYP